MCHRARKLSGAAEGDVHDEGEGQLREAGVREAGRAQALRAAGGRGAAADTRSW